MIILSSKIKNIPIGNSKTKKMKIFPINYTRLWKQFFHLVIANIIYSFNINVGLANMLYHLLLLC